MVKYNNYYREPSVVKRDIWNEFRRIRSRGRVINSKQRVPHIKDNKQTMDVDLVLYQAYPLCQQIATDRSATVFSIAMKIRVIFFHAQQNPVLLMNWAVIFLNNKNNENNYRWILSCRKCKFATGHIVKNNGKLCYANFRTLINDYKIKSLFGKSSNLLQ